jgi:hypothetical protein
MWQSNEAQFDVSRGWMYCFMKGKDLEDEHR